MEISEHKFLQALIPVFKKMLHDYEHMQYRQPALMLNSLEDILKRLEGISDYKGLTETRMIHIGHVFGPFGFKIKDE